MRTGGLDISLRRKRFRQATTVAALALELERKRAGVWQTTAGSGWCK